MSSKPANPASPLYEQVKAHILARIGSGLWPSDRRIPSENELVEDLGISRMTINRALRELTAEGVLKRVQGVGTFIAPPKARGDLLELNDIAGEIRARGQDHRADVILLERIPLPPDLRPAFTATPLEEVFHSVIVHREGGTAMQLEERYVNPALVPDYGDQDFTKTTPYEHLVRATPVTELEHVITAIAADDRVAHLLEIPPGAPCLLLERRTWTGDQVATVNTLIYVGERYSLGGRRGR
ncbi:MAG: histidine utilization repressor [Rhodospirillum sp.]|nr:histidine utilization repressor [Rhodospirillum sp.]MCF8488712.1 histidine utilization repressor [Rhodospirillum sp.]MCF8502163.1 histidine utilization repressor [Rhodospirillum sp.]